MAPAGDMQKLKTALSFGADAVYLGGYRFGLRALAGNFAPWEMEEAVAIAHAQGKKVYVTVNVFANNQDIEELPEYLGFLARLGIDGLIVSDLGVVELAKSHCPGVPITLSTQANVTNWLSAAIYGKLGVRRVVLARELSLWEIEEIIRRSGVEVEVFVHGAMCLSYSGRCWLSYAMTGRSANKGLCAHPCRYRYYLVEEKRPHEYFPVLEDERGTYVMNSKDLCLVEYVPFLMSAGVDAFKIEGRMRSVHYLATVVRVYREAIDNTWEEKPLKTEEWLEQLKEVQSRPYTKGFIAGHIEDGQDLTKADGSNKKAFCGLVKAYDPVKGALIEQRASFRVGDALEIVQPGGERVKITVGKMYSFKGEEIEVARHAQELVWLAVDFELKEGAVVVKINEGD